MAKILFSTVSGLPNSKRLPCFYEGFVNALLREGNDVMLMITNDFFTDCWQHNQLSPLVRENLLIKDLMNFNPDLVITFNNSLYEKIPTLFQCPIAVWATDSPAIFSGKKQLRKNANRYDFICAVKDLYPSVNEYFKASPDKLHTVHFASDFIAEHLSQDKNISFIGTNFSHSGRLRDRFFEKFNKDSEKENFLKFFEAYKKDILKTPGSHLQELGINAPWIKAIPHSDFLNLISSNFRVQTLQSVCDLGLQLFGTGNWYDVLDFSLELALCYGRQEISSVKENQDLYNQSKIAINITHAQAKNGFGWRVRDIMATNACLVSDYREELITQFGEYVKIPTYRTPYEARELCQKLLKDDIWRREVVEGSQLAIEKGHRFKHRLSELENIFSLKLTGGSEGKLIQLLPEDFASTNLLLEKEIKLLRKKISFIERGSQYQAMNVIYNACSRVLPRSVKHLIKKYLV
jgi:hypothetical protein